MIDQKRREMFGDLYKLAEDCEKPPFVRGDTEGNVQILIRIARDKLDPFLAKYGGDKLAEALAMAVYEEAGRLAKDENQDAKGEKR